MGWVSILKPYTLPMPSMLAKLCDFGRRPGDKFIPTIARFEYFRQLQSSCKFGQSFPTILQLLFLQTKPFVVVAEVLVEP